jgi:hypothetical protein
MSASVPVCRTLGVRSACRGDNQTAAARVQTQDVAASGAETQNACGGDVRPGAGQADLGEARSWQPHGARPAPSAGNGGLLGWELTQLLAARVTVVAPEMQAEATAIADPRPAG